jgi:hypothetical protein
VYEYSPEQMGVRPAAQISNRYLIDAFTWMFLAVLLSAVIAWVVENDSDLVLSIVDMRFPLFIAQMAWAWACNGASAASTPPWPSSSSSSSRP